MNKKNNEIRTAVGYTRVSTDRQVDGISHDVQERAIREYAKRHNIVLEKIYWDGGYSAKTAKRPELQQMLADIENGNIKVDAVIVYNLSRISRDLMSFSAEIAPTLVKHGIELRSTCEDINSTPQGKFMMNLSIALHQLDNDNKSKTVADNMQGVAEAGYWQSHAPVGMRRKHIATGDRTKDGKFRYRTVLEPDPENDREQKAKDVLDYFAEGDKTIADAVRFTTKIGFTNKAGKPFTCKQMGRFLTHPALAGYICSENLTGGEYIKAQWDGIIPLEQHLLIKELRKNSKNGENESKGKPRTYRKNNPDFPLKGILKCAKCGATIRGSAPTGGNGKPSPRYHCADCTGAGSVMPSKMHDKFLLLLARITPVKSLLRAFGMALTRTMKNSTAKAEKAIAEKEARLAEIQDEDDKSFKKAMQGERSEEQHERYVKLLREEAEQLASEIEELKKYRSLSEAKIKALLTVMENPAAIWRGASLEIRQILQQMIFPNGVEVDLETGEFGTQEISPLYSVISTKKGAEKPFLGLLVGEEGLEPSRHCCHKILSLVNGSVIDYFTALLLVFNWGLEYFFVTQ